MATNKLKLSLQKLCILKHFDDYNFFSSEDNKIIFEKLKPLLTMKQKLKCNGWFKWVKKISISEKPF